MEKNKRMPYGILTAFVLTFSGLLSVIMSFYAQFYYKYDYSAAAMIFFAIAVSAVFSGLFNIVKRKWSIWVGLLVIMGIFFMINREAILGGSGTAINEVINETSGYFDCEMYYLDIPKLYARHANEVMALYCFILLISAVYSFCISTPRLTFIPWLISLFLFVYPLILEKNPGGFWVLFGVVYLLVMAVTAMSCFNPKKSGVNIVPVQMSAIIMGIVVCIVGTAAISVKPEKEFKRSEYFSTVYDKGKELHEKYKNGELAINKLEDFFIALNPFYKKKDIEVGGGDTPGSAPMASGTTSQIGAGELGQVDELVFSGEDVLQVIMPNVDNKVYIKGYTGTYYLGNRWLELNQTEEWLEIMGKDSMDPQTLTFEYLNCLSNYMPIEAYSTTMEINYIVESDYKFMPLYSSSRLIDFSDSFLDFSDADLSNTGIKFIDFNQNQLRSIDSAYDYENMPDNMDTFFQTEEIYRAYVYEKYLDVNTTIAEQLRQMWGESDIEGAAERYDTACSIRKYLSDNCRYNSKPGKLPEGRDFVEYFLNETHEGYCTYFATAAVMMLRSAGIPARYVEGYSFWGGSTPLSGEALYTKYEVGKIGFSETKPCVVKNVPDSAAHAWIEYYVDGVGWVDFEVTPGNYTQQQETTTEQPTTAKEETNTTAENTTTAPSDKPTQTAEQTTESSETKNGFHFRIKLSKTVERILICAAVFAAAVFVFVLVIKFRHKGKEKLYEEIFAAGDNEPSDWCIKIMYNDYLKILKHFGYVRKEYETEVSFAKRVAESCDFVSESEAVTMAELFEKAGFSEEGITGLQKAEHWKIHMRVRERMYGYIGIIKQLLLKYIYNL